MLREVLSLETSQILSVSSVSTAPGHSVAEFMPSEAALTLRGQTKHGKEAMARQNINAAKTYRIGSMSFRVLDGGTATGMTSKDESCKPS